MLERKIKQEQLARSAGIGRTDLTKFLSGTRKGLPPVTVLQSIATELGLPPISLVGDNSTKDRDFKPIIETVQGLSFALHILHFIDAHPELLGTSPPTEDAKTDHTRMLFMLLDMMTHQEVVRLLRYRQPQRVRPVPEGVLRETPHPRPALQHPPLPG